MDAKFLGIGGINLYNERVGQTVFETCSEGYNLVAVTAGEGEVFVEGAVYSSSEFSVFLLKPMTYFRISSREGLKYTRLEFSDGSLSDMAKNVIESITEDSSSGLVIHSAEYAPCLIATIKALNNAYKLPGESAREYSRGVLHSAVSVVASASGEHIFAGGDDLGARIRAYVNDNLTSELSLEGLERVFFVSKYYLCRAFKKYSGASIHSYLTRKRIALAARLIESGEPASSVAYKVGFGDYSAFYRAFVKYAGRSPMGV